MFIIFFFALSNTANCIEHTINLNKELLVKGYAEPFKKTELIPPKFRSDPTKWPDTIPDREVDATGICTRVIDGDTIYVQGIGKVRLAGIDTPEKGQPGYEEAKDYTTQTCLNHWVYLDIDPQMPFDKYNRVLAVVYVGGTLSNASTPVNTSQTLPENTKTQPPTGMKPTGTPTAPLVIATLTILATIIYTIKRK